MSEKLPHVLASWHTKLKSWYFVWHVGRSNWNISMPSDTMSYLLTCWYVMRSWDSLGTFTNKPCWHVNTLTHNPRWYAGTHDTQISILFKLLLFLFIFIRSTALAKSLMLTHFFILKLIQNFKFSFALTIFSFIYVFFSVIYLPKYLYFYYIFAKDIIQVIWYKKYLNKVSHLQFHYSIFSSFWILRNYSKKVVFAVPFINR